MPSIGVCHVKPLPLDGARQTVEPPSHAPDILSHPRRRVVRCHCAMVGISRPHKHWPAPCQSLFTGRQKRAVRDGHRGRGDRPCRHMLGGSRYQGPARCACGTPFSDRTQNDQARPAQPATVVPRTVAARPFRHPALVTGDKSDLAPLADVRSALAPARPDQTGLLD